MFLKLIFPIIFLIFWNSVAYTYDDKGEYTQLATTDSIATGFFINDEGFLVTAFHVIEDNKEIYALLDKRKMYKASIIKIDENLDLALLKIDAITPYIYLSHSKGVPPGMAVVTIGYPQATLLGLSPKITQGIVNSANGIRDDEKSFQFSAEVQQGNSGGPLIAPNGTVIGIVQSKLDALKLSEKTNDLTQNVNFATKSAVLLEFLSEISNIPTTQPLQPESPLKAVRIYEETVDAIVPVLTKK